MSRFLKNIILSAFSFLLLVILFEWATSTIVKDDIEYNLKKNTSSIILGHSQPECAYNDSLISGFQNISRSAEPYFYTYYKLKLILKQNPQVERVFLEFSNNYLEQNTESWTWKSELLTNYYPDLSHNISLSDKWMLLKKDPSSFIIASSLASKYRIKRLFVSNFDYSGKWGGYNYLERNKTDSLLTRSRNDRKIDLVNFENSLNLKYLEKIISYSRNRNVEIYLIRSPLHPEYNGFANEAKFREILEKMLKGVVFLDFSRFPLANEKFADLKHLNHQGARIYSNWFQELLDKGLLDEKDKQEFIDMEIKKYAESNNNMN